MFKLWDIFLYNQTLTASFPKLSWTCFDSSLFFMVLFVWECSLQEQVHLQYTEFMWYLIIEVNSVFDSEVLTPN